MLARFSLYGFLKNQRYFEPFLVLAFLDKGLSFFWIGVLVAWRELWINLLEVPSGAIADVYGRRRAMIGSFAAYIVSFVLLGLCDALPLLLLAMTAFALGEAFRTGTHKAMIFSWLRAEDRIDERTRIYGYTRSWSKIGSAVSVAQAALLVGPVYVALHLGSGLASRRAHRVVARLGGEARAGRALWVVNAALFALMLAAVLLGWQAALIASFVVLHLAQNVWRPVLIGRLDAHLAEDEQATVLSIESQAKTLVTLALAPLVGWAVDQATLATPEAAFWPVAALGLTLSLLPFLPRLGGRT
jgi:MFS family permease